MLHLGVGAVSIIDAIKVFHAGAIRTEEVHVIEAFLEGTALVIAVLVEDHVDALCPQALQHQTSPTEIVKVVSVVSIGAQSAEHAV